MENYNNKISQEQKYNSSDEEDMIDLRQLLKKYLQHWHWFVFAIIISFILAKTYLKLTVNKYNIQTTIQIQDNRTSLFSSELNNLDVFDLMGGDKEVEDEIQVLSSIKLIKQTIDELGIQTEYYKRSDFKYIEQYKNLDIKLNLSQHFLDTLNYNLFFNVKRKQDKYLVRVKQKDIKYKENFLLENLQTPFKTPFGEFQLQQAGGKIEDGDKYKIIIHSKKRLIENYKEKLSINTVTKKTDVIQLSLVEENVLKARNFLDKIIELYNKDAIDNKNILAKNTANFIRERLFIVGKQLSEAEENVENFKRSENLTDIVSEATLFLETSSEYKKKITELEIQLNLIDYVEKYLNTEKIQLIPINVIGESPALSTSIEQYNKLVLEMIQLQQTASLENPTLVQLRKEVKLLKNNVLAGTANSKKRISISLKDLKQKDKEFKSKIRNVPTQERLYFSVKRQQEIKQKIYIFLLQRQEEVALQLASTEPIARTIDNAYASLNPVSPKGKFIYLFALVLGLAVPFVIVYLLDLLQNKIETKEEFKSLVKVPFLGSICVNKDNKRVVVKEKSSTPIIEMFRLIRTNLQFMNGTIKSPVILVTSTVSGEGKSFTSINLAMSLALTNKKVVLVGLDIRRPKLNEYLEVGGKTGVTLYLSENIDSINDIIVPSIHHPKLDLIPSGPVPPNPAELIMSERLEELMTELKNRYDYIIVDTAPVGVVTDTYLLNRIADMTVYVSRKGFTPKEAIRLINEISDNKKLKNMSVVLNGTNESTEYGYTYGYRKKSPTNFMFKETFNDKLNHLYKKVTNKEEE